MSNSFFDFSRLLYNAAYIIRDLLCTKPHNMHSHGQSIEQLLLDFLCVEVLSCNLQGLQTIPFLDAIILMLLFKSTSLFIHFC
jgi:hypothetical protein